MAKSTKGVKKAVKKTAKRVAKRANAAPPAPKSAITPYLAVSDAAGAIAWYKEAYGAKVVGTQPGPGGKLLHAHLRIAGADLYMSDIFPNADLQDPSRVGASVSLHLWTRNVDKMWDGAVKGGAKVVMPLDDQFWGDRYGKLVDPYGHSWSLAWKSKLSKAELEKKRVEAMKQFGGA